MKEPEADDVNELHWMAVEYFKEYHRSDIIKILEERDVLDHYSVTVNALTLFESNMLLGDTLLAQASDTLTMFDSALQTVARSVLNELCSSGETSEKQHTMKRNIHARCTGLPVCPELTRETLPKNDDIGRFLSIAGTVIRTCGIKLLDSEKEFMCTVCKHIFSVQSDMEQYFSVCKPTRCPNPSEPCNNINNFVCTAERGAGLTNCRNYQEIKIQEQVHMLSVGTIPRSMWVILMDDLVDMCKPGDDVYICGSVMRRWRGIYADSRCDVELCLNANHVQVINDQQSNVLITKDLRDVYREFWDRHRDRPLVGRNEILASICPQVYGLYVVKLAVALVLAGGVQRVDESGTRVRGESHLLLVGDPGTGKSQFLKYSCKVVSRSVLTTGIGSTSAGLTVTAVKDGGEWQLEAGALVLADGGICCIDEFNSIKEADRCCIHEAMEQQTISVAKAGLVCKLNTRCSVLAATNPKGQYDTTQSLSMNVALATPLLSRFDLVLVLLDTQNEQWDKVVSSYILEGRHPNAASGGGNSGAELWSMEKIRNYLSLIKELKPELTDAAMKILSGYYCAQRQVGREGGGENSGRTTMRLLESLVRLSQAHAKLMFKQTVTVQDACVAITLVESSMMGSALLGDVNTLHTSFPADPELEYRSQVEMILGKLGLNEILEEELKRLDDCIVDESHTTQSTNQSTAKGYHMTQPSNQNRAKDYHVTQSSNQNRDIVYHVTHSSNECRAQASFNSQSVLTSDLCSTRISSASQPVENVDIIHRTAGNVSNSNQINLTRLNSSEHKTKENHSTNTTSPCSSVSNQNSKCNNESSFFDGRKDNGIFESQTSCNNMDVVSASQDEIFNNVSKKQTESVFTKLRNPSKTFSLSQFKYRSTKNKDDMKSDDVNVVEGEPKNSTGLESVIHSSEDLNKTVSLVDSDFSVKRNTAEVDYDFNTSVPAGATYLAGAPRRMGKDLLNLLSENRNHDDVIKPSSDVITNVTCQSLPSFSKSKSVDTANSFTNNLNGRTSTMSKLKRFEYKAESAVDDNNALSENGSMMSSCNELETASDVYSTTDTDHSADSAVVMSATSNAAYTGIVSSSNLASSSSGLISKSSASQQLRAGAAKILAAAAATGSSAAASKHNENGSVVNDSLRTDTSGLATHSSRLTQGSRLTQNFVVNRGQSKLSQALQQQSNDVTLNSRTSVMGRGGKSSNIFSASSSCQSVFCDDDFDLDIDPYNQSNVKRSRCS